MENWGLSVFVEQKILLDPEVSSFSYQMELTMVVVHEICHQKQINQIFTDCPTNRTFPSYTFLISTNGV
ncbi:thyrotropin-releasing hormone-degrading ectoenzyme-like [Tachysurus ichikawai]